MYIYKYIIIQHFYLVARFSGGSGVGGGGGVVVGRSVRTK